MKVTLQGMKITGEPFNGLIDKDITWLDLFEKQLRQVDLTPLSNFQKLVKLDLSENNLATIDLEPLSYCQNLKEIHLSANRLVSINLTPLGNCQNLEELYLSSNRLMSIDLNPLSNCQKLTKIDLRDNELTMIDFSPLSNCPNLKSINVSKNQLLKTNLLPLSNSSELIKIDLDNNHLKTVDLTPLSSCQNLKELFLKNNRLTRVNLTPLSGCQNLAWLDLRNNQLKTVNLQPLSVCQNLVRFEIEKNPLERLNLAPLSKCPNLKWLKLNYSELDAIQWEMDHFDIDQLPEGLRSYYSAIEEAWKRYQEKEQEKEGQEEIQEVTLLVLGSLGAGKTTLLQYLRSKQPVESSPRQTHGIVQLKNRPISFYNWEVSAIDVGGAKIYREAFWPGAITQTEGIIYLIDSIIKPGINPSEFQDSKQALLYMLRQVKEEIPLLIFLNKQDLQEQQPLTVQEIIQHYNLSQLLLGRTYNLLPISAKTGRGVEEGMTWLLEEINEKRNE